MAPDLCAGDVRRSELVRPGSVRSRAAPVTLLFVIVLPMQ